MRGSDIKEGGRGLEVVVVEERVWRVRCDAHL